jgi:hypothetical protein
MQTFAEFMAESFNSNAKLVWDYPRRSHATATFYVDGIKVTVSFEQRDAHGVCDVEVMFRWFSFFVA